MTKLELEEALEDAFKDLGVTIAVKERVKAFTVIIRRHNSSRFYSAMKISNATYTAKKILEAYRL